MKPWKLRLFRWLAFLTILSLLLSACVTINLGGNSNNDKNKEKNNNKDIEKNNDKNVGAAKITICHKTGSTKHPYVMITVSSNAARNGRAKHQGDIIPAPKHGCPSTSSATVPDNVKDNENETENETEDGQDTSANKITICHQTGSAQHPYVEITVSNDAAKNGHAKHQGDIIPAPIDGCPKTVIATDTP